MKVVAFVGSARKEGNTVALVRHVFAPLEAAGIECELIELVGKRVHGCTACMKCAETKDGNCHGVRDFVSDTCIPKALEADGIIIASPVYFADVSSETKALIDRLGYASRQGGSGLSRKVERPWWRFAVRARCMRSTRSTTCSSSPRWWWSAPATGT